MCIIALMPANKRLTDAEIRQAFQRNDDGFGIMYPDPTEERKIMVRKIVPATADDIIALYNAELNDDVLKRPHAVHFRFRTHGDTDKANTHPYRVLRKDKHGMDLYLMHNGVITSKYIDESKEQGKSDTWHYVANVLRPTLIKNPELVHDKGFLRMVAMSIGYGNKFVMMPDDGHPIVVNHEAGTQREDGIWFSSPLPTYYYGTGRNTYNQRHYTWQGGGYTATGGSKSTASKNTQNTTSGSTNTAGDVNKSDKALVPFDPMNSVLLGTAGNGSGLPPGCPDPKDGKYWDEKSQFRLKEWQNDCTPFFTDYVAKALIRANEKRQSDISANSGNPSVPPAGSTSPIPEAPPQSDKTEQCSVPTQQSSTPTRIDDKALPPLPIEVPDRPGDIIEQSKQLSVFAALKKIGETGEELADDEYLEPITTEMMMQMDDDDIQSLVEMFPDEVTEWIKDTLLLLDHLSLKSLR